MKDKYKIMLYKEELLNYKIEISDNYELYYYWLTVFMIMLCLMLYTFYLKLLISYAIFVVIIYIGNIILENRKHNKNMINHYRNIRKMFWRCD